MTASFDKGNIATIHAEFSNSLGAPADPTLGLVDYKDGTGEWHLAIPLVRDSVGFYHLDVSVAAPATTKLAEPWIFHVYSPPGDTLQASVYVPLALRNPGKQ